MPNDVLSGAELERALRSGQLSSEEERRTLVALVKPSETEGQIGLSLAGCEDWVDFPTKSIERAEQIGESKCLDHSHPVFRIQVKEASDGLSKALLDLITKVTGITSYPDPPTTLGDGPASLARLGTGGFGGFGGFGSTLPTCRYVRRMVPCGSALPGYPVPMCPEIVYCCRWPNGTEGCM